MTIPYQPTFLEQVGDGNVGTITAKGATIDGTFEQAVRYPDAQATATTRFSTEVPEFADDASLDRLLRENGVQVVAKPATSETPLWLTVLIYLGPALLFFGLWMWYLRRAGAGGGGGIFSLGRAKPTQYQPTKERVSFDDVAGIDEAEQELAEVVDFLRDPAKYRKLGARIPRGVLLSGSPGTGKTLLARAVAGEAGVPFFSMSASEFVEMIVGVGASRVRDLFDQAKKAAPSIVFVDEIDAIGRSRGSGVFSGANDEREQTLNQILTEMDGFDASTGVIVLAATNRPDVLDPALLRPGRFDRRVTINPPDKDGREHILRVHTRSSRSRRTSTRRARGDDRRHGRRRPRESRQRGGAARGPARARARAHERLQRRARAHRPRCGAEADADRLRPAQNRLPRGRPRARRHAHARRRPRPEDLDHPADDEPRRDGLGAGERSLQLRQAEPARPLEVATAGRAAEEVVFGDETTGAENDIRQATQLARSMVGRFGMSDEIGFVSVLPQEGDGWAMNGASQVSERTRQRIDDEVKRVVEEAHARRSGSSRRTAAAWTGSPRRCFARRRSTSRRRTPPPGSLPRPRTRPPPVQPRSPSRRNVASRPCPARACETGAG